jgi:hypothetical protein
VWQTASIFIALSLAGIALLGQSADPSWGRFFLVATIGIASVFILHSWARILRRWTSYDRITLYRMREIETDLGMWKNRYIDDLDYFKANGVHREEYLKSTAEAHERLDRLTSRYAADFSTQPGGSAVGRIRLILMTAWVAIVIIELVRTLLNSAGGAVIP